MQIIWRILHRLCTRCLQIPFVDDAVRLQNRRAGAAWGTDVDSNGKVERNLLFLMHQSVINVNQITEDGGERGLTLCIFCIVRYPLPSGEATLAAPSGIDYQGRLGHTERARRAV